MVDGLNSHKHNMPTQGAANEGREPHSLLSLMRSTRVDPLQPAGLVRLS